MLKSVFVINPDGTKLTSYVDNFKSEEKLMKLAKENHTDEWIQFVYKEDGLDMMKAFESGLIYADGKMIEPSPYVPSDIELKEQEVSELNEEFKTAAEEYLEAMRKALLLSDTSLQSEIQTDYKDLLASYTDEVARLNAELVELKGE